MNIRAMAVLCLAVWALISVVGTVQTASAQDESPTQFTGELTGTNVYVRSNSRDSAYPCTKLSAPAQVMVVGHVPGWYKILPPPGVFSVISKQYVQSDAAGTNGEVTGDNVWVRAGGELRNEDFWSLQTQLNRGDKVQISGQVGEYYKIVPPEGAYFWISDRYVRSFEPTSTQPAAPAQGQALPRRTPYRVPSAPAVTTTQPAAATATMATTMPAETKPAAPESTADAMARFREVETELREEFKKAPEQRDLDALIAKFKAIEAPEDSNLKPYIEYWVSYLEAAKKRRVEAREFEQVISSAQARQRDYELRRAAIEVGTAERQPVLYAAEGVLQPSAIYTGSATTPKRYVVRDPATGAIKAYVQNTTGEVRLAPYAGKYVGVMGDSRYMKELRSIVVEAQQISVLREEASVPQPPKPKVEPLPPAPAPAPSTSPAPAPTPTEPTVTPQAEPKVVPAAEPQSQAEAAPEPVAVAEKPDFSQPAPEAKPAPAEPVAEAPIAKPAPTTQPVTATPTEIAAAPPAAEVVVSKPLPPTGLPLAKPTSQPVAPINEDEFN